MSKIITSGKTNSEDSDQTAPNCLLGAPLSGYTLFVQVYLSKYLG